MDGQFDLFGALAPEPTPAPPAVATYQHYSTATVRHICVRCMVACYLAEKHGNPPPPTRGVAWRRQYGEIVEYLCCRHKTDAHAEDTTTGRLAKPAPGRRAPRVTA